MMQLEIRKVPYIGKMLELVLNDLGIKTCQDIIDKRTEIFTVFTPCLRKFLISSALGIARCYHGEEDPFTMEAKSVSSSRTHKVTTKQ